MLTKHFIRLLCIVSFFTLTSRLSADVKHVAERPTIMTVICEDRKVLELTLKRQFNEEPIAKGDSASQDTMVIYMNKTTQSYTIVRYQTKKDKGCIIDAGQKMRPTTATAKEI